MDNMPTPHSAVFSWNIGCGATAIQSWTYDVLTKGSNGRMGAVGDSGTAPVLRAGAQARG